jgi:hypothetical protein
LGAQLEILNICIAGLETTSSETITIRDALADDFPCSQSKWRILVGRNLYLL